MTGTSQKKKAEEAVLRMVYDLEPFESVEESERPDFVLRRRGRAESFGVEVTRFYHSEASARLEHIKGYVSELLKGGKHRHKDDLKALVVDNVTLQKADGSGSHELKAIIETYPPVADHIRRIAERIDSKGVDLAGQRAGLNHVNLIVLDKTGRFAAVEPDVVATELFRGGVWKAAATTRFREVFYIVDLGKGRTVYFPLRMLLLVSELFIFNGARTEANNDDVTVESRDDELTLFASFMRSRGVPVMLAGGTPDEAVEVVLGNSGVICPDDNITIHNYMDWPVPVATRVPPDRTFSEGFVAFYEKYAAAHVFKSGLVFDVRESGGQESPRSEKQSPS